MINKIEYAIGEARSAAAVDHMGMRGTIREIAVENLFKPLLTREFDIGNGKIVDYQGRQSDQTDVIIYSKSILPAFLYSSASNLGLYPAEACIFAIEVKSIVNAAEVKDALKKASQLRTLEYSSGIYDDLDRPIHHITSRVIPMLFAFGSDLTENGKSEIERYMELDTHAEYNPLIHLICVVGKGCWSFKIIPSQDNSRLCKWAYLEPSSDYNEVLGFLGRAINSLAIIADSRGAPRFGNYVHDMPIVVAKEGLWKNVNGRPEKIQ